jgi:hypothetical protein
MWQESVGLVHTQPPVQWLLGAFSAEVKWQDHEDGLSPPRSAEAQKEWSCISTLPYAFMALPSSYVTSWIQIKNKFGTGAAQSV